MLENYNKIVESYNRYGKLKIVEPPFLLFSSFRTDQYISNWEMAQRVVNDYFETEKVFDCWPGVALSAYLLNSNFHPARNRQHHNESDRDLVYFHTSGVLAGERPRLNPRLLSQFIRNHRKNERNHHLELRGFHLALSHKQP